MNQYEYRDPTRFVYNEYINQTSMHPIALGMILIAIVMLFTVRTRYWFIALACLICMTGPAQRVVIAGVDFQMLRLIGCVGIGIAAARGMFKTISWNTLDTLVLSAALLNPFMATLRGQSGAVMMHLGFGVDAMTMYLLGRIAIQEIGDFYAFAKSLALLSVPLVVFLMIEKLTARNFFSVMGGIPEFTAVRFGKLRAQGAFAHPIIAGCWFAAAVPLIAVLLKTSKTGGYGRSFAIIGIPLCIASTFATASSTPIAALMAGVAGLCVFPYRAYIRPSLKIGFFIAIILHFVSASGFHHILYTRFTFVAGSTGYFRYRLADAAINQFGNWFVIGTNSTYSWGYGLDDCTHEFILAGVKGGVIGLGLLIAILVVAFRRVGTLVRSKRSDVRWVGYCIGVSMLTHIVSFNGTSYFGQAFLIYYFTLGALQTLAVREGMSLSELGRMSRKFRPNARMVMRRPSAEAI